MSAEPSTGHCRSATMMVKRTVGAFAAAGIIATGLTLYANSASTADAQQAAVSTWLTRERAALVDIARTAKLAEMCQAWRGAGSNDRLEATLRDRVGAQKPLDREYAALAIRQGETDALIDFKAAPRSACGGLEPAGLHTAANYLSGRTTLRTASAARPPSSGALP